MPIGTPNVARLLTNVDWGWERYSKELFREEGYGDKIASKGKYSLEFPQ